MNEDQLRRILYQTWSARTSSDPEKWTPENPSWGQCAVTACIVQNYFGGSIVWANATLSNGEKISHYFNRIADKEIDLTREQFPEGTYIPRGVPKRKGFPTTREYVLSFSPTKLRYEALERLVDALVCKHV